MLFRSPAPDVNTNAQVMTWLFDEYSSAHGYTPACCTGKPVDLGGSLGREQATGRGVSFMVREAARDLGLDLGKLRICVQGFGNVGSNAALLIKRLGCKIVGVSDVKGGIYDARGLALTDVLEHVKKTGSVVGFPGADSLTNEELLESDCDVLIPAALECVLHGDRKSTRLNSSHIQKSRMPSSA